MEEESSCSFCCDRHMHRNEVHSFGDSIHDCHLIGPEGCLLLISGLNVDIVETPTDIQLGEVSSSTEL